MGKQNFSFDIVSEVDLQEVDNAVNQLKKEVAMRYDFKNSKTTIEYSRDEKTITYITEDDFKLRAIKEMLKERLIKRKISIKSVIFKEPEQVFGGHYKQVVTINTGIDKDKAKELVKIIKAFNPKIQAQIEGEKVRVFSPKKDDLQDVMAHIRAVEFSLPLSFCNYR
ncbi:MAG: YajQ family cyclic di-GMP-binding protein [Candidatus Omnitrophica bacterium]|nr:YajQ family cyclic di-GMP-binding protein [Candidatus Omnitrophota bacterium]